MRAPLLLAAFLLAPTALGVSGAFPGAGWVALRYDTTGPYDVTLTAYTEDARDFFAEGFARYSAAKEWNGHALSLANSGVASTVVKTDGGPGLDVRTSRVLRGADIVTTFDASCAGTCPPRTFYWVLFQAGELSGWDYVVHATGATVAVEQGNNAFGLRTSDFEEGTVASGAALFTPASVAIDARHDESAPHELLVWFLGRAPSMRMVGPGIDVACPCQRQDVAGPYAAPPGSYEFLLEGANAPADVVLVGASPRLPS